MANPQIQKNILDLNYQKHLQIAMAALIIFFTVVIGLTIAFVTQQLGVTKELHLFTAAAVLFIFGSACFSLVSCSHAHMKRIIKAIERLE